MKSKLLVFVVFLFMCIILSAVPNRNNYYLNISTYASYKEFLRGVNYFNQERYDASIESFKTSLNSNPSDKYIRYWYSRALYKGGYISLAINEWRNLTRMGFTDPIILSKLNKYATTQTPLNRGDSFSNFIYLKTFSKDRDFIQNINQVIEIKVDKNNNIYALDYSDNALKIFDVNGKMLRTINKGKRIDAPPRNIFERIKVFIFKIYPYEKIKNPRGFALDNSGNIYIANTGSDNVLKFNANGENILVIGSKGIGDGNLLGPTSLSVDDSGKIYVADTGNNRISVFDEDGIFLYSFASMGEGDGQLFRPSGILVGRDEIYVADTGNARIVVFDMYGNFVSSIHHEAFREPRGLSFSLDNNLYIADSNNVYYYDISNKYFTLFQNSSRYTAVPTSVVEGLDSTIYISDFLSGKIDVYARKEQYYNNLDVFIDRSYLNKYPAVVQKVTVRDNLGNPIVGLNKDNFFVYENDVGVVSDFFSDKSFEGNRFIYLIEDSEKARNYSAMFKDEIEKFTRVLSDDDEVLVIHYNDSFRVNENYDLRTLRILSNANNSTFVGGVSSFGDALNEAIRLSGASFKKTAIIHYNVSDITDSDFKNMTYNELANYAKNNGVSVTEVYFGDKKSNYFLDVISKMTYSKQLDAQNSIDYTNEINYIKNIDFGIYYVRYNTYRSMSEKSTYRPIKVQVQFRDMYGEEESGYVIP